MSSVCVKGHGNIIIDVLLILNIELCCLCNFKAKANLKYALQSVNNGVHHMVIM